MEQGSEQFMSPAGFTSAQSYVSAQSQEVTEGNARSVWLSFGEMFQRRVVAPVMNAGKSFTGSTSGQGVAGSSTGPLLSSEVQRAMEAHRTRPSSDKPTASSARRGSFIQQRESGDDHG